MFTVIRELKQFIVKENTNHVLERAERDRIANQLIKIENGKICKIMLIDKGHANGLEVHVIYNNGVVKIYNYDTGKYITVLIARYNQITRYGIVPTKTMEKKIKIHVKNNLNNI